MSSWSCSAAWHSRCLPCRASLPPPPTRALCLCPSALPPAACARLAAQAEEAEEGEELDEDDMLLARMEAGLYTLHQVRLAAVLPACCCCWLCQLAPLVASLLLLLVPWLPAPSFVPPPAPPRPPTRPCACHSPRVALCTPAVSLPPQCALIIGSLWVVGDQGVRKRILKLLHQQGRTLGSLRSVLLEYRGGLGADSAWGGGGREGVWF